MPIRRWFPFVVAGALAGDGIALAMIPVSTTIALGKAGTVHADCRPPVLAAWSHGPKDELKLWAVTVGTEMQGYSVKSGAEPWCAERARPRLALAGGLVAASILTAYVGIRLRRSGRVAPATA